MGAGGGERSCSALDEIGMLAARHEQPGWLASTLLLSNPYPILSPAGRYCGSSG